MNSTDTSTADFAIGGYRYRELKRNDTIQLWEVESSYGNLQDPAAGFAVTCQEFAHWAFPADPMRNFPFSKSQKAEAEKLFDALVDTDKANRCGLGRGYIESLRRASRPVQVPQVF
jgi:hypothetical protein